jgi:alkylation response protein AidB-like acyl-CoA dehydrogenase
MEVASLTRVYAAKYIAIDNAKTVADELFQIMEVSIKTDSSAKQESTKDFLVKIIETINDIDSQYADEIAKLYLDATLSQYYDGLTKK